MTTTNSITESSYSSILRQLTSLGGPIILGQLGILMVNFADTIMVGRYHTDALAAASFVNNIYGLFFVLGLGFSYGLTPLVARAFARGNEAQQGRLLQHSTILNLALTGVLILILLGIYWRLDLFHIPEHLLPQVRPYFILQLFSLLAYMAMSALKQFFDGLGQTKIPMWTILAANVLNVIGNYLLIFGPGPFPELGLFGAGLSTLLSRVVMLVVMAWIFLRSPSFAVARSATRGWRLHRAYFARLFRLGLPVGIQTGVEAGAWTIAIIMVTPLGQNPLAVHQILTTLSGLGFLIYYGLGAATTILVSQAMATGNRLEARRRVNVALALCEAVAVIVLIILIVARHQVGWIFNDDPAVIAMAALAIIPMALYQPADACQVIYSNALRGMEDVSRMAVYATCAHLIFGPSLSLLFAFGLGLQDGGQQLTAIWAAFPISLSVLGLVLRARFLRISR